VLRIRLSRTGKRSQESFRLVVAEHTISVKGKYLELLGNYKPANKDKKLVFKKERIEYWLTKGAKPSPSVASLLKRNGVEKMEQYIPKSNKHRTKKKGAKDAATPAAPTAPAAK
jgi:small subunit ribosomal protein S16